MSKNNIVNYIGDDNGYLDSGEVADIAALVIGSYWRLRPDTPEEFIIDINVVSDSEIKKVNKVYLSCSSWCVYSGCNLYIKS